MLKPFDLKQFAEENIFLSTTIDDFQASIIDTISFLKKKTIKPNVVVFVGSRVWNILENILTSYCSYESGIEQDYNYVWSEYAKYVATFSNTPIFLVEQDFWDENETAVVLISDGWRQEENKYYSHICPDEVYPKGSFKDFIAIRIIN